MNQTRIFLLSYITSKWIKLDSGVEEPPSSGRRQLSLRRPVKLSTKWPFAGPPNTQRLSLINKHIYMIKIHSLAHSFIPSFLPSFSLKARRHIFISVNASKNTSKYSCDPIYVSLHISSASIKSVYYTIPPLPSVSVLLHTSSAFPILTCFRSHTCTYTHAHTHTHTHSHTHTLKDRFDG